MQMETKKSRSSYTYNKVDFKTKTMRTDEKEKRRKKKTDEEGHYIMEKVSIQQEAIMIVNIYVPNIEALRYKK